MHLINIQIIIFLTFLFSSCDPTDNKFTIVNKTGRPIFYDTSPFDTIEGASVFKPFYKIINNDTLWIESDYFIKPMGEKTIMVMSDWEEMIEDNYNGKISVFIFDADTLQKYRWNVIKSDNKFIDRYKFGIEELKEKNWKVVYDGK
jgi:hypothetical protein